MERKAPLASPNSMDSTSYALHLVDSLVANTYQLLEILTVSADQATNKVQDIKVICNALNILFEQYRQHQAIDTVKFMIQTQCNTKTEYLNNIKSLLEEAKPVQ